MTNTVRYAHGKRMPSTVNLPGNHGGEFTGPRSESMTIILLNQHSLKLSSELVCLSPYQCRFQALLGKSLYALDSRNSHLNKVQDNWECSVINRTSRSHFLHYGSGTVMEEGTEILQEPEIGKDQAETVSSELGRTSALMNSQQLQFPVRSCRSLCKIEPVSTLV